MCRNMSPQSGICNIVVCTAFNHKPVCKTGPEYSGIRIFAK
jgi:hypothetical protein